MTLDAMQQAWQEYELVESFPQEMYPGTRNG